MQREFDLQFAVDPHNVDVLPDGSRILYGAVIVSPIIWMGQIRDIIVWADGTLHMGANQARGEEGG